MRNERAESIFPASPDESSWIIKAVDGIDDVCSVGHAPVEHKTAVRGGLDQVNEGVSKSLLFSVSLYFNPFPFLNHQHPPLKC